MRLRLFALVLLLPLTAHATPIVDWLDLLPEEDYQAMLAMPEIEHDWDDEAPGDFGSGLRQRDLEMPEVMFSTRVVEHFDGQVLQIGGYPVPLEMNERGRYVSFFLVPYAGACIHVPPPPPNQIILVNYPTGIEIDDLYVPFWISGTLHVEQTSNELADASYRFDARKVWLYDGD